MFRFATILFVLVSLCLESAFAQSQEICVFRRSNGRVEQVASREDVPAQYRKSSRCFSVSKQTPYMADPNDISLKGNVRTERISSPIGPVDLRWPRSVEVLFGRTPQRATQEAAYTVSKVIRGSGFPTRIQQLNLNWQIVFMDENMPQAQIPAYLRNNCHPGWMTPPAKIYIVSERVASGCSGQTRRTSVADSTLAEVLIHEMGHAVEHHLLEEQFTSDRMRAEGFATWFEEYASEYSTLIDSRTLKSEHRAMAKEVIKGQGENFSFAGGAEDYARASLYFDAIVERGGVYSLMEIYETMREEKLGFFASIQKRLGWDKRQLEREVLRIAGK